VRRRAPRGGDLVVAGASAARTEDRPGRADTIITLGDDGSMNGFMSSAGRQIILRPTPAHGLGTTRVRQAADLTSADKVSSSHRTALPAMWTDADPGVHRAEVPEPRNSAAPPSFQKYVCGKKLYNYDNIEAVRAQDSVLGGFRRVSTPWQTRKRSLNLTTGAATAGSSTPEVIETSTFESKSSGR